MIKALSPGGGKKPFDFTARVLAGTSNDSGEEDMLHKKRCPSCNEINDLGTDYCRKCGEDFPSEADLEDEYEEEIIEEIVYVDGEEDVSEEVEVIEEIVYVDEEEEEGVEYEETEEVFFDEDFTEEDEGLDVEYEEYEEYEEEQLDEEEPSINTLEERIAYYQDILKISPEDPVAHNKLGHAYFQDGNLGDAEIHYKKALTIYPDYSEGYYNIALLYREQGNTAEDPDKLRLAFSYFEDSIQYSKHQEMIDKAEKHMEELMLEISRFDKKREEEAIRLEEEESKD